MKSTIRVPMPESFAYLEFEFDGGKTPEEVLQLYREITKLVRGETGTGLSSKDFNAALDEYLGTSSLKNGSEIYAKMNEQQQQCFQEIKKSIKRITSREPKPVIEKEI